MRQWNIEQPLPDRVNLETIAGDVPVCVSGPVEGCLRSLSCKDRTAHE
jgi:hypothetical protein